MRFISRPVQLLTIAVIVAVFSVMAVNSNGQAGNLLPQPEEKIVYHCSPGAGFDICIVNPDGSGYQALTNDSTGDNWPRISPDGQTIVWQRSTLDLWTMNVDGSNKKELLPNVNAHFGAPTWSPDGQQIGFICNDPQDATQQGICTMSKTGSGFQMIRQTVDRATNLEWSPDGNRMLVGFETQSINEDIFVLDLASEQITNVTNTPDEWEHGTWSPDGEKIAFVGTPLPGEPVSLAGLYVMDRDGGNRTRLITTPSSATATPPTWSPDGEEIAFFCNFREICIVDADSGALNNTLTEDFIDKYYLGNDPDWALTGGMRFGDVDCNRSIAATDGLKLLQHNAGLNVTQTEPCPDIESEVGVATAGASLSPWGDIDCNGAIAATDALAILRWVAGLPVNQTQPCLAIGTLLVD